MLNGEVPISAHLQYQRSSKQEPSKAVLDVQMSTPAYAVPAMSQLRPRQATHQTWPPTQMPSSTGGRCRDR